MSSLDKISNGLYLNKAKETENINAEVKRLNIKISSPAQLAGKLSGGNQQKVMLSRWIMTEADVFLLEEPTRGVDVGAKAEIYQIMDELTKQGKSIILISTDLPEVIGMSDRVVIMREGYTVLEIDKSEMNQEKILAYASGGVSENE